jgi:hypothetical protein
MAAHPGDHGLQFQLGLAYLAIRDRERAEPVLRAAIRPTGVGITPEWQAIALMHLAQCAFDRSDSAQASRDARAALTLAPDSVKPRYILGLIAYRNHRGGDGIPEGPQRLCPGARGGRRPRRRVA